MKKLLALLLTAAIVLGLAACGSKQESTTSNSTSAQGETATATLSFSASNNISELKTLDGKRVSIIGYMATMSPISGAFLYLMNLPYQSCPFCVPNTTQLANTLAVYAPKGKSFAFTDQAIKVTGTLKVEDYSDEFGYEYNYRIIDAAYTVVDLSSVNSDYALWTALASDGVISEIYGMFDYLYFICMWQDYQLNYYDEAGQKQTVPMWPGDVIQMQEDAENGYKTQTDEGYFKSLIARVRAISPDKLEDLVAILEKCEGVRSFALSELYGNNFYYVAEEDSYKENAYDELYLAWQEVWFAFTGDWISKWQL